MMDYNKITRNKNRHKHLSIYIRGDISPIPSDLFRQKTIFFHFFCVQNCPCLPFPNKQWITPWTKLWTPSFHYFINSHQHVYWLLTFSLPQISMSFVMLKVRPENIYH